MTSPLFNNSRWFYDLERCCKSHLTFKLSNTSSVWTRVWGAAAASRGSSTPASVNTCSFCLYLRCFHWRTRWTADIILFVFHQFIFYVTSSNVWNSKDLKQSKFTQAFWGFYQGKFFSFCQPLFFNLNYTKICKCWCFCSNNSNDLFIIALSPSTCRMKNRLRSSNTPGKHLRPSASSRLSSEAAAPHLDHFHAGVVDLFSSSDSLTLQNFFHKSLAASLCLFLVIETQSD